MSSSSTSVLRRLRRVVLLLIMTLVFAGLVFTVLTLPPGAAGLTEAVNAELAATGIRNPVTATLLNFRSYDTLLEIAVLLLAVTAIQALRSGDRSPAKSGGDVLAFLGRILAPIMILIAGYLLWAGADAHGGAFQAGAILAGAGVLLILAGHKIPVPDDGLPIRLGLAIGLAAFVAFGIAGALFADAFLDYPRRNAANVVLFLEVGATLSIALALLVMYVSVLRAGDAESTPSSAEGQER